MAVIIHLFGTFVFFLLLLSDHTYKKGHILSETLLNLTDFTISILDDIVKQSCNNGIGPQRELLCYNLCYTYRVHNIWFTTFAHLSRMGITCKLVCFPYFGDFRFIRTDFQPVKNRFHIFFDTGHTCQYLFIIEFHNGLD